MRTPRSEAGFALIEVVVSAAVLAIVALAVLSGIDAANGASAREKARAVAASLAEQDQERLRTMPVDMLKSPPQAPAANVDGVTYTIKSEAKWITDDVGGSPACGVSSGENQVEYLQIKTTVTSNVVGPPHPGGHRRLAGRSDHEVGRGSRHARREGRRPHRHRRRRHHGHPDLARVLADRPDDQRPGLRPLEVGPGRQLHDHAQHAGLHRRQGHPALAHRPERRRQEGQLPHDPLRPPGARERVGHDARPGHELVGRAARRPRR